jgi:hypothetical protein
MAMRGTPPHSVDHAHTARQRAHTAAALQLARGDIELESRNVSPRRRFKPLMKGMATAAGSVYMVCGKFEQRHQNRRFLLDQLKTLLAEACKAGTPEDPLAACPDFAQHKAGYDAVVEQHRTKLDTELAPLLNEVHACADLLHFSSSDPSVQMWADELATLTAEELEKLVRPRDFATLKGLCRGPAKRAAVEH